VRTTQTENEKASNSKLEIIEIQDEFGESLLKSAEKRINRFTNNDQTE
jgi:hypothetical protein